MIFNFRINIPEVISIPLIAALPIYILYLVSFSSKSITAPTHTTPPVDPTKMRIGILNGSTRHGSNTAGVIAHFYPLITRSFPSVSFELIHLLDSPGHPLPLLIDDLIPARQTPPDSYADPKTRAWSKTVGAWDGVLVISPQYNWGIPGLLKHSFDVIFNEYKGKPAAAISVGGRGGGKAWDQLKDVMGGGLKMRFVDTRVAVTLPGEVVAKAQTKGDEEWITKYDEEVVSLVKELVAAVENPPPEEQPAKA